MKKFLRNSNKPNEPVIISCKYSLAILKKYVGKNLEVHYLEQGIPKIEKGMLVYEPNEEFFYLGNKNENSIGYHSICWDRTDSNKKRSLVTLILDEENRKVYENNSIIFDYAEAFRNMKEKEEKSFSKVS